MTIQSPITLRAAQPEDAPFLLEVYASTRADELRLVDWSPEQKRAFVEMQFNAQTQHYSLNYPQAKYFIIQHGPVPIGRLIVDHSSSAILIMDIALLPEYRGRGIGTGLLAEQMAAAQQAGKPLRLHVETFNPAQRLYQRLGFHKIAEMGVYYEMEWNGHAPLTV